MVTQDVTDKTIHTGKIEVPKGPNDYSPKKSEKPGYLRGIPGLRDDDKPKSLPAAGKPSRPRQTDEPKNRPKSPEKSRDNITPGKLIRKIDDRPVSPEKIRPAAGKPSRIPERPDRKKPNKIDKKIKSRDQSPDSLDDDDFSPKKLPVDVSKKIPPKEQCICELCTCG